MVLEEGIVALLFLAEPVTEAKERSENSAAVTNLAPADCHGAGEAIHWGLNGRPAKGMIP